MSDKEVAPVVGVEEIRKELEREVSSLAEEINNIDSEHIEEFLSRVIDILVIKELGKNNFVGFSILLTMGGPNVVFEYSRGVAEIKGTWGGITVSKSVNIEKAEEILEYLNNMQF